MRQREDCPALGQEKGLWTFPAPHRDGPAVPEMQSQYISCEVGEGISLPEGIILRCREALREGGFTYKLQTPRCLLMPAWWEMVSQMAELLQ